jgi:hypothetical protein
MIKVTYTSIDHCRKVGTFKTLAGARTFAQKWVGKRAEIGSAYAISDDGVGKITVDGCSLQALFGEAKPERFFTVGRAWYATRKEAEEAQDGYAECGYVVPQIEEYQTDKLGNVTSIPRQVRPPVSIDDEEIPF